MGVETFIKNVPDFFLSFEVRESKTTKYKLLKKNIENARKFAKKTIR